MPCNGDYMDAKGSEIELSRVACLLDELNGKPINANHWKGYHPSVYCKSVNADALVQELCERLQSVDVKKHSLEMQMWWRDHQEADKARIAKEIRDTQERELALSKLTSYEKKLLGIK